MSRPGISFNTSGQTYNVPQTTTTGYINSNYNLSGGQIQPTTVTQGSQFQSGQQVYASNYQPVGTVQRTETYTMSQQNGVPVDNFGYSNEFGYGGKVGEYGTTTSVGQYGVYQPVSGVNYHVGSENNYVASTGGASFTVKPTTVNFQKSGVQTTTIAQPVSYVSTLNQPVTYVQPVVYTQPVQQQVVTTSYVQPTANQWVEEEFERPKYPKLYNNTAEYYRNLAPEEDPSVKKSCCSPCCWVLWGLLGLLAMLFGILCGLGILCGGGFSFGLPSVTAPALPDIQKPNITLPDINIPTPNITLPDINIPAPNITLPDIKTPTLNITLPDVIVPTSNITIPEVPVTTVTPVTPPEEDFFIDPAAIEKIPVVSTTATTTEWKGPTTTWSSNSAWSTSTSATAANAEDAFIDPSVTAKVPIVTTVPTTDSYYTTSYPVTSPSTTYSDSGYRSTYDASSTPVLGSDPATWSPYPLGN